jgi:adiponectin receptor
MLAFIGKTYLTAAELSRTEITLLLAPVVPSLLSYIIGLIFYAAHFPERILSEKIQQRLDCIGGGT